MTKIASLFVATLLALSCHAVSAQAQLARTYVSSFGNDANDCNRLTPCRTFQRAHDTTLANGEITVLDPGGYGAVNITKTISIINDGVGEAGILVSGGAVGISINAGVDDRISLRGLTVKGIGFGGGTGVRFTSGGYMTVENCAIRNLTGHGIEFAPIGSSRLAVSNTLVADNGGDGFNVRPTGSGTVRAMFTRVESYGGALAGIAVIGDNSSGKIEAIATDSVVANHNGTGFYVALAGSNQGTELAVFRSVSANNFVGAFQVGAATLRLGESMVTGNASGLFAANFGNAITYGTNSVSGNGAANSTAGWTFINRQ